MSAVPIAEGFLGNKGLRENLLKQFTSNPASIGPTLASWFSLIPKFSEDTLKDTLHFCTVVICGSEDIASVLKELVDKEIIKNNVCGKIWKEGDNAYKCNDCEVEASCAICIDCFNNGNHVGHNFKMIKVAGGVCDCGDFQSWKPSGFCTRHKGIVKSEADTLAALPEYLRFASQTIFSQVLKYFNECVTSDDPKRGSIVLGWLEGLGREGDVFRVITASEWSRVDSQSNKSILDDLLNSYDSIPPKLREQLHNVFFPLLFISSFRVLFLRKHFIPYYKEHIDESAETPDEDDMISAFPMQIFPVPECGPVLKEEKILEFLTQKLYELLKKSTLPTAKDILRIDHENSIIFNHQYSRYTLDIQYAVTNPEMGAHFLVTNEIMLNWCKCLQMMMNMDNSIVRITADHAEYDSESWIPGFLLEMEMLNTASPLLNALSMNSSSSNSNSNSNSTSLVPNPQERIVVLSNFIARQLQEWFIQEFAEDLDGTIKSGSAQIPDIKFKVSTGMLSYHIPLHRTLSMFIHEAIKTFKARLEDLLSFDNRHIFAHLFLEHPLRLLVLQSQIRVGMWRRNGREVWAASTTYDSIFYRDIFRDLDLFAIQLAVVLLGPDPFVKIALKKFELLDWLTTNTDMSKAPEFQKEMLEEFIKFLVVVATERIKSGSSDEALVRREIIHRLCVSECSHSQLTNHIEPRLVEHPQFEKILKEVAIFHHPKGMEQGTYQLKDECWAEFDHFFSHYNRSDLEKAEERYNKQKSKLEKVPLSTPTTYPQFSTLRHVLHSSTVMKLIFTILHNASVDHKQVPETLINETLHLLLLSIQQFDQIEVEQLTSPDVKRKRKSNVYSGSLNDLDFPANFNLTKNARQEVPLENNKSESILSLLRKLAAHIQDEKIQQILKLFEEKDPGCRISVVNTPKESKTEGGAEEDPEELEKKKKRKERQAEILKKFNQQMKAFQFEEEELGKEEEENLNPFLESGTCALCHEETSIQARPLGFVALTELSRFPQVVKQLQIDPPINKLKQYETSVREEEGKKKKKKKEEDDEEEEVESDDEDMYSISDEEEEEMFGAPEADRDTDKVARATAFMYRLMQDPELAAATGGGPMDMAFDEDDTGDEEEDAMSISGAEEEEEEDHEDEEDEGEEGHMHDEGEENDVIYEEDMEVPIDDAMQVFAMTDEIAYLRDKKQIEKDLKAVEQVLDKLESEEDEQAAAILEEQENKLANLQEIFDELRESAPGDNSIDALEEKLKKVVERCVTMIKQRKIGVLFDVDRGSFANIQFCNGHVIHIDCFKRYLMSLMERQENGESYEGEDTIILDKGEYLCVVCRRLANWLVPIVPFHLVLGREANIVHDDYQAKLNEWLVAVDGLLINDSFEKLPNFNLSAPMSAAIVDFVDALCGTKKPEYENIDKEKKEDFPLYSFQFIVSSIGSTLSSSEIELRGKGYILNHIEKLHKISLRSLFYCALGYRLHHNQSKYIIQHQRNILCILKGIPITTEKLPTLLSFSMFSILIQSLMVWPRPSTLIKDFYYLVNLLYRALFMQILLHYVFDRSKAENLDVNFAQQIKEIFLQNKPPKSLFIPPNDSAYIQSLCLPFMRKTALLLHTCLDKNLPSDFYETEFEMLTDYLRVPKIQDLANSILSSTSKLEITWVAQFLEATKPNSFKKLPYLFPATPFSLIPLPELYHELLQKFARSKCKKCDTIPQTAALCLICGTLVCAGSSCCRGDDILEMGECNQHTKMCSSVGLFLVLKMSSVLVIRGERVSFWGSPYLDEHGEEDIHLSRGSALYLNKERYQQLTQLFVSHRIEYESRIIENTRMEDADWY